VLGGVFSEDTRGVTVILGGNVVETGNPFVVGSTVAPEVLATAAGAPPATVGAGASTLGSWLEGTKAVDGVLS
jgi:hypothetical protein